jgi:glycosyltransferase involved in cell wall biosynthesis
MRKLALVISSLTFGGAERQVVEISNKIDRDRFDPHVFILSNHAPLAAHLREREARLHVIEKRSKYDVTVIPRLARAFRELEVLVVHGFNFDAEIASRIAGKLAGVRAIIGSERNTKNAFSKRKKVLYRTTSRLLHACVANSTAGAAFNRKLTGLPESAYHVVYNGVDTDRFRPRDASALRASLDLPKDVCVIGMFGSFKHQKNHPLLLKAAKLLMDRSVDFRLLFVGTTIHEGYRTTDEYSSEVMGLVESLGLEDRSVFVGAKTDVEHYYNLCDMTVLPSFFEGTPNVALESMASAVAVIATDVSDNSYVIPDGSAGYIVPLDQPDQLANRMHDLVSQPVLRRQLGQAALDWVIEEFSLGKMATIMADVYEQVLDDR